MILSGPGGGPVLCPVLVRYIRAQSRPRSR